MEPYFVKPHGTVTIGNSSYLVQSPQFHVRHDIFYVEMLGFLSEILSFLIIMLFRTNYVRGSDRGGLSAESEIAEKAEPVFRTGSWKAWCAFIPAGACRQKMCVKYLLPQWKRENFFVSVFRWQTAGLMPIHSTSMSSQNITFISILQPSFQTPTRTNNEFPAVAVTMEIAAIAVRDKPDVMPSHTSCERSDSVAQR